MTSKQIEDLDDTKHNLYLTFARSRYLPAQPDELKVKSLIFAGSLADQHVLRPPGPVLDAGAGGAAAQQRHDLHEPAHHGPASR